MVTDDQRAVIDFLAAAASHGGEPVKRIDYLFMKGHCRNVTVIETEASDHRPVLIELR